MRSLGYPASWPTTCFINGGCGAEVFAHTNGYGDFVLLDGLGSPWPVHDCYIDRFSWDDGDGSPSFSLDLRTLFENVRTNKEYERERHRALASKRAENKQASAIRKVSPHAGMARAGIAVTGIVQDVHERHRPRELRDLGSMAEQVAARIIGRRHSQLTVLNGQSESFTFLADLSGTIVARGDLVTAEIRFAEVLRHPLFLCDRLSRLTPGSVLLRSRSRRGLD